MDCLQDYIGLKQCSATEPESGYYINDLPGISTELAHRIADQEQLNFAGVWNSVQKRSQRKFGQLIQRFINHNQNWQEILYQTPGYKIVTPLAFVSGSAFAATVTLPEGKYIEGNVKSLLVYSETAVTGATLTITDSFGNTLKTITDVALNIGLNRKPVNFAVGAEESGLSFTVTLSISEGSLSINRINLNDTTELSDCATCEGEIQQSGYIIPEVDIKCAISRYICENKAMFTYALWYLHGAELLAEKLTSPRTTYFSTSNLEYTKNLQNDFYTEFSNAAQQALKAIDWQGLCITCKEDNPSAISFGSLIV